MPAAWRPIYARILKEKYGVKFRVVAGCGISWSVGGFMRRYNPVAERKINTRFGHDVFAECEALARAEYDERVMKAEKQAALSGNKGK